VEASELVVAPGTDSRLRLGGHELLLELAAGGMATVYIARKMGAAGFERLVVVKRVHPAFAKNHDFADMFRDEARICATIRHPNVVAILDVVETGGELFLVLEYVESLSLSALSKAASVRGEALPPDVVVRIVVDVLSGLHAAHEAKDMRGNRLELIHRDVSPANVIVGLDGSSRLIDFGIAKAASRISVTSSGILKGKLSYMAPEQVRRRPLDRRADVFAAGVILFEALTGRKLFTGDDEGDIVLGILITEIPSPSSIVPGLPPQLDVVVQKALAREREERYQTAAEFGEALERALTPAPARAVSRVVETYGGVKLDERRAVLQAKVEGAGEELASRAPAGEQGTLLTSSRVGGAAPSRGRGSAGGKVLRVLAVCLLAAGVATAAVFVERRRAQATPTPAPIAAASESDPVVSAAPREATAATAASVAAPVPPAGSPKPSRSMPRRDLHRRNPYGPP
jgi:hypothetical protein